MKIILKPGHLPKTRSPVIHYLTSLPPPGILFLFLQESSSSSATLPSLKSRKVTVFYSVCGVLLLPSGSAAGFRWGSLGQTSFLEKRLPPVEGVVGPVREGEDGRVH